MSKGEITLRYPNEELLEKMIEEEERQRLSIEYQNKCTMVKNIPNGWLKVTEELQRDIVRKYGFTDKISADVTCNMMRRAHILYPKNEKFKTIPLYVRNNKANKGQFKTSDTVPNIDLADLNGKMHKLHDLLGEKPSVILALSGT